MDGEKSQCKQRARSQSATWYLEPVSSRVAKRDKRNLVSRRRCRNQADVALHVENRVSSDAMRVRYSDCDAAFLGEHRLPNFESFRGLLVGAALAVGAEVVRTAQAQAVVNISGHPEAEHGAQFTS